MSGEENRAGDDSVIGGDDPTTVGDEEVGDDTPESAQNLLDALVSALLIPVDIAVEGFRAITLDPVDVLDIFRTGGDIGGVLGQTLEEVTPADEHLPHGWRHWWRFGTDTGGGDTSG